jgi:hypothetical protein
MPKPMTIPEADAALRAWAKAEPNDSPQWKALHAQLDRMPAGASTKLLAKVLGYFPQLADLADMPAHFDDAIVALVDSRARKDADAAFVTTALRTADGDHHARLRELLRMTMSLSWAGNARPERLRAVIARADLVAGAQAAVAVERFEEYVVSRYVPILAADASRESLDILLPFVEQALDKRDGDLDWLREKVVPLLGDAAPARGLVEMLADAARERTEASPALAFARELGMVPPPATLKLTLSYRDGGRLSAYQIRVDSTRAAWFQARRNEKWLWRGAAPNGIEVPPTATSYVLRVSSRGADRAKLDAWAKQLMAKPKRSRKAR